jgi:hypothetical protein
MLTELNKIVWEGRKETTVTDRVDDVDSTERSTILRS